MAILLFGNVWQRIALVLLLCTHAGFVRTQEGEDEEGTVRAGDIEEAIIVERSKICAYMGAEMDNQFARAPELFAHWPQEQKAFSEIFSLEKPHTRKSCSACHLIFLGDLKNLIIIIFFGRKIMSAAHRSTVCFGLNSTCCKRRAENLLHRTTIMDYKKVYRDVLQEHFSECSGAARNLYRKKLTYLNL